MGQTLADIHRNIYRKWRSKGLSHDEAMQQFPERLRSQIEVWLEMDAYESHFGSKSARWLVYVSIVLFVILLGLIMFTLIKTA
jgi:hypothetical protein